MNNLGEENCERWTTFNKGLTRRRVERISHSIAQIVIKRHNDAKRIACLDGYRLAIMLNRSAEP